MFDLILKEMSDNFFYYLSHKIFSPMFVSLKSFLVRGFHIKYCSFVIKKAYLLNQNQCSIPKEIYYSLEQKVLKISYRAYPGNLWTSLEYQTTLTPFSSVSFISNRDPLRLISPCFWPWISSVSVGSPWSFPPLDFGFPNLAWVTEIIN